MAGSARIVQPQIVASGRHTGWGLKHGRFSEYRPAAGSHPAYLLDED